MMDVPHLTDGDIRAALEEQYKAERRHHLFAFHGTGTERSVTLGTGAIVHVVPVRSELELRDRMPPLGAHDDERIAFLVPFVEDVPIDLAGRFAGRGRVRRIGDDARIRQLFGVSEVDAEVGRLPLTRYLLRPRGSGSLRIAEGRLTADMAWGTWLWREWSVPFEGGLELGELLGFAATDRRGAEFVAAMADPAAVGVRDAWLAHLTARLGQAGAVVWKAWEETKGVSALELALVFEALADRDDARIWVRATLRQAFGLGDDPKLNELAQTLGRAADGALRFYEARAGKNAAHATLVLADSRVDDREVRRALEKSTRLPSAWGLRLDAFGKALEVGVGVVRSTDDRAERQAALESMLAARAALQGHAEFRNAADELLLRVDMAARLFAWLVARPELRFETSLTPHGDAETLGRWYAEEGGFVDWARRRARCTADGAFTRGVMAVVDAADAARTELDRRFASALREWNASGQPATQVLPISDVSKRLIAPFMEERPERRLLVLLMDGMAWAQAVELLQSLGSVSSPWGPLAWHASRAGRIGEGQYPVMFAAVPTVTEVSRSAFFAGQPMKAGASLDTSKDPAHWAANPSIKKLSASTEQPRLLLRSEGHTQAGSASPEALSLIADADRAVVAMVVNAIDDSLKASHAVRHAWNVDSIASLPELLAKARDHGRAVLLVSDHGHVPADRLRRVQPPVSELTTPLTGGGARWRPWPSADALVAANEVAFAGNRTYAPRGAHGVVLLADDASVYAGNTHAGEHGGATLAEVVAPCVLIGCDDANLGVGRDSGLATRSAFVPGWWHFDVRYEVSKVADEPKPAKTKPREERQLGLPTLAPTPAEAPPKPVATTVVTVAAAPESAFGTSAVLAARAPNAVERSQVVRAVDVLLDRSNLMSAEAFAAALEVHAFRVQGFVSKLQEVLNLDGYDVLRFDSVNRQVHLDREKLVQLFEVKL